MLKQRITVAALHPRCPDIRPSIILRQGDILPPQKIQRHRHIALLRKWEPLGIVRAKWRWSLAIITITTWRPKHHKSSWAIETKGNWSQVLQRLTYEFKWTLLGKACTINTHQTMWTIFLNGPTKIYRELSAATVLWTSFSIASRLWSCLTQARESPCLSSLWKAGSTGRGKRSRGLRRTPSSSKTGGGPQWEFAQFLSPTPEFKGPHLLSFCQISWLPHAPHGSSSCSSATSFSTSDFTCSRRAGQIMSVWACLTKPPSVCCSSIERRPQLLDSQPHELAQSERTL